MKHTDYPLEELVPIVSELAPKYSGYEHSSITYEKAQMLMEGVLYCIREYMQQPNHNTLLTDKISAREAYTVGQKLVTEKVRSLQELYNRLIFDFQDYGMECLRDVMIKGIPAFLRDYDFQYAPQETLLTLDYPILKDISSLSGVDAVLEYTKCLELEQQFLREFDHEYVIETLRTYHTDYELLMENICHIVLSNTLNHMIADKPLSSAEFNSADRTELAAILSGKSKEETERYLTDLFGLFMERFFEGDELLKDYLGCAIPDIVTKIFFDLEE